MKHILPILTLALLGAAVTVFADNETTAVETSTTVSYTNYNNYYYDYYRHANITFNPIDGNQATRTYRGDNWNESDSVTYNTMTSTQVSNGTAQMSDSNTYTIHRESNWETVLRGSDPNNFFRIEMGETNDQTVRLYLTDFVSSKYGSDSTYYSDSNALFNDTYGKEYLFDENGNPVLNEDLSQKSRDVLVKRAIVEYGYRTLEWNEDTKKYDVTGKEKFQTVIADENGAIKIGTGEVDSETGKEITQNYKLNDEVVTAQDTIKVNKWNEPVTRYKYDLGEFNPGDIIEVYMKDYLGNEVYSFSSLSGTDSTTGQNVYTPFDNTDPETSVYNQGGFGDGGWAVNSTETDDMLDYYFSQTIAGVVNPNYHSEYPDAFGSSIKTVAAARAMPLSQLIPGTSQGLAVAFGLMGVATGNYVPGGPLPGGLQMALIAGLFGLGFCYIRRRKAIVG
jgi:hypothetical protein